MCLTVFRLSLLKLHEDQGYEASEESTDDRSDSHKKYLPLLYIGLTQPNAFFAKQQLGMKFQVCFCNLQLIIAVSLRV